MTEKQEEYIANAWDMYDYGEASIQEVINLVIDNISITLDMTDKEAYALVIEWYNKNKEK